MLVAIPKKAYAVNKGFGNVFTHGPERNVTFCMLTTLHGDVYFYAEEEVYFCSINVIDCSNCCAGIQHYELFPNLSVAIFI